VCARFGVEVIGRHTALGDALATAEVLVRMIPLLRERGIHTLGDARRASASTELAGRIAAVGA
jgi:DNA polymerase-3 subunit epsilon